jgi:hypothetical protein
MAHPLRGKRSLGERPEGTDVRDLHLLLHTVALAASGLVLGAGLWRGDGVWITAKKMAAAYLACFCLGVVAALVRHAAAAARSRPRPVGDADPDGEA